MSNKKVLMCKIEIKGLVFLALFTPIVAAQTAVTTSGGTANNIPRFLESTTLADSAISQLNESIVIRGTTLGTAAGSTARLLSLWNTAANVNAINITQIRTADGNNWETATTRIQNVTDVTPQAYLDFNPAGGMYGLALGSGDTEFMRFAGNGNIGIATKDPNYTLTFGHSSAFNLNATGSDNVFSTIAFKNTNDAGSTFTNATVAAVQPNNHFADAAALTFSTAAGHLYERMRIVPEGYVGIGTTDPRAMLEVNGAVRLTSGSGASITFSDNTVQSTAWNGTLCGGDYAESVDISGRRDQYEPGDVLVVDSENPGHFLKASEPYSMAVSGIYSTKPGLVGRRQTVKPSESSTEIPMAMIGVVPTKVSAENGSIKPGDILVTSSTLGHAMKGTDRSLFAGAIVGKALGSLSSGTGVIEVLVSLE